MSDTGFRANDLDRLTSHCRRDQPGSGFELIDPPRRAVVVDAGIPLGRRRVVSTADDWCTFGRMLLAGGDQDGRRVLLPESVDLMMTSHVEAEPDDQYLLQGQGWGFGGSVDLHLTEAGHVPGRYGWVGGTGTPRM
ncbi:MAG: hypothetical protein WKF43_05365 [Acidimicrobiales bacterium]